MFATHYQILLDNQAKTARATYKSTIGMDRVIEIIKLANSASLAEKTVLRKELHDLLKAKYTILKEKGIYQYHFVLPNNESFYRAHKPSKFGDDLTEVRKDFNYVNKTKKPVFEFTKGKTIYAFRNTFPLFDRKNNHIGAMEVSFPSKSFERSLETISKTELHFVVDKRLFDAQTLQRDELSLKYKHINANIVLGKAFSVYVTKNDTIEIVSFLPIYGMDKTPQAWMVSYEENSIMQSILSNVFKIRVLTFLLSLLFIYFIFQRLSAQQKLKDLNLNLEKITNEQNTLLSLFDVGESVLFKWKNDAHWSIAYVSQSVQKLLGYSPKTFMQGEITYKECIHADDLERVMQEIKVGSSSRKNYFTHKPYRVLTKDNEVKWIIDNTIIQRNSHGNITHFIGYLNDITEIKNQQQLLDEILNSSDNPIFLTDFKNVLLSNDEYKKVVNKSYNHDVVNLFLKANGCLHEGLLQENEDFTSLLSRTDPEDRVVSITDKDLGVRAYTISASKIDNSTKCLVTLSDITQMQKQHLAMAKKAYTDGLTQIYNRNKFDEVFKSEFASTKRYHHPLSVVIIDIDKFKYFNDTYGHAIGDEVLITLAKTLNNNVRATDTFARWGGEEFVILFKNTPVTIAKEVSEKLKAKIQENKHAVAGTITASFGVTEYKDGDTIKSIFKRCDDALYLAKENGRNRVEVL